MADFVMATSISFLIINEARNLSRRLLEFFEFIGNVANGVHTIVQPHELVDAPHATPRSLGSGSIELSELDFSYTPERKVFDKLNLHIPAGQRVGLVGSSGSGKSTFVSLILRLYDSQGGSIRIDGVDIRHLTQDALHAQLSLIPQDPTLFHRSLLENIRYGKLDASDEEVVEAARRAHAHEFIAHMPEQYRSLVGERGVKLSGVLVSLLLSYLQNASEQSPTVTRTASEIAPTLAEHGVRFERWRMNTGLGLASKSIAELSDAHLLQAYAHEIERAQRCYGYLTQDVVRMQRDADKERDEQAYQQKVQAARSKFLTEHVHAEDEVRCFAQGSGLFSLRLSDQVFQVLCEAGDMLSVPAGTRHWFDMGSAPSFCALRLFGSPEGWVARFTDDPIAKRFPSYDEVAARWR